ncbi:flagellar hook-associated protein FlgL [Congregibacter litoralis]|uniref:Flagellar hook-associated protein 3 n=1 Tax=Congregibacter litoralis KT71 TaxID=314285 RepID=A4A608_9GAMM|nr:flagellar hook-associated protein FlgL [Congregibacter litoralis]EAQ98455.1 flagellar hook-associated protein 3 [Congregibacter litoralis KT71]
MVDRLSTLQIFQSGISTILDKQADLARTQQELATGKRIQSPSDDPSGAVKILDLEEDIRLVDQYQRNASLAEGQLAVEETTLSAVNNVLQRVRELTVQANNATQSPETRASIAVEVNARIEELVALANTRDGNDEYLFAGFQAQTQPFSRQGGTVTYSGDDGQRFLDIAASAQVAVRDSGSRVFLAVDAGNGSFDFAADPANTGTAVVAESSADGSFVRDDYTVTFSQATPADPVTYSVTDSSAAVVATGNYTPGDAISFNGARLVIEGTPEDGDSITLDSAPKQSIFDTLQGIADALENSAGTPSGSAAVNNALASGLNNLDQAIGNVLEVQSDVGVRLNRIESQQSINEDFNLQLQTTLSDVQDVDFAEAISKLNLQLVALQAAQQTYVTTQGLTLFNYL